jgi:hypothetical protein
VQRTIVAKEMDGAAVGTEPSEHEAEEFLPSLPGID